MPKFEFSDEIKSELGNIFKKIKKGVQSQLSTINDKPVFVLGNQKSGTTAIAVLLARYADMTVDWDPIFGEIADIYRGKITLDTFVKKNKLIFSKDVIKDPNFTFIYCKLLKRFPEARFVMVMRDPRDNIRSILDRFDFPGNEPQLTFSKYIHSFSEYNGNYDAWRFIFDGSWMGLKGKNYIDMLAARWQKAASIYLNNKNRIELIKYENFVDNKERTIAKLAESLGLPKKKSISQKVHQQFQPRGHRRNMKWIEFFGSHNLNLIESRCVNAMKELGYTDLRLL